MILNRQEDTLNSSKDKRSLADQSNFSRLCHKNSSLLLFNKSLWCRWFLVFVVQLQDEKDHLQKWFTQIPRLS